MPWTLIEPADYPEFRRLIPQLPLTHAEFVVQEKARVVGRESGVIQEQVTVRVSKPSLASFSWGEPPRLGCYGGAGSSAMIMARCSGRTGSGMNSPSPTAWGA
jgi:hypothetical protein